MSLMPDVSFLTEDEELGAQPFSIIRSGGRWFEGKFIEEPVTIQAFGNVQPATDDQINQVPEGDRTSGMISIWTTTEFVLATQKSPHMMSDVVEWNGSRYKVVALTPWIQYGFNVVTLARMRRHGSVFEKIRA